MVRRMVCALLATIMIMVGYAFCEEISFRDVPWFCTESEFAARLKADGINAERYTDERITSWVWTSAYGEKEWAYMIPQYIARYHDGDGDDTMLYVAGYPVASIHAYFLPNCDEEKLIIGPASTAQFTKAYYHIDSNVREDGAYRSKENIYNDLVAKLTKVYGEPTASGIKTSGGLKEDIYTCWWVEGKTGVSVVNHNKSTVPVDIDIVYDYLLVKDYAMKLDRIREGLIKAKDDAQSSNVDGL